MKKRLKLITLLLAFTIILTSLASCSSKIDNEINNDSDESNYNESNGLLDNSSTDNNGESVEQDTNTNYTPEVDASKFPDNAYPIFDGSAYTLKVVVSEKASSTVRQVATTLRSELKKKTKNTISESNDYLKSGAKYDDSVYEILVGETKHAESASIYDVTDYNNYGIKTIGRKIVLYFSSADEGNELVKIFINAIKSNDKNAFWIEGSLSTSKTTTTDISGLPKYPGTSLSTSDCGDNTQMVVAKSTNKSEFDTYCKTLTSSGYTEYSTRDVSNNYFRTYIKGSIAVTAYYSEGRKQARIIVGPAKDIPSKDTDTTKETFTPSVTMIGPSESVSGSLTMIYMLANGKFLIFDGGITLADRIYKELKELQPNATKYTIAGWFISHPHNDHQDGIELMIEQHIHDVDIENIYVNYAPADYYDYLTSKDHQGETNKEGKRVTKLREILETKVTRSTKIVKPHTGQIYNFGSAKVEIMSTVEDILPTALPHINEASMVVRVTVAGQSTMILADAADTMKGVLTSMYSNSHLKSDMLTLAHHGVWDNVPALYDKIQAKVLFWPNNTAGARMYYTDKSTSSVARQAIQHALDQATDVFLAKGTDTKLDLPYTPVGNKQSFINSTLK